MQHARFFSFPFLSLPFFPKPLHFVSHCLFFFSFVARRPTMKSGFGVGAWPALVVATLLLLLLSTSPTGRCDDPVQVRIGAENGLLSFQTAKFRPVFLATTASASSGENGALVVNTAPQKTIMEWTAIGGGNNAGNSMKLGILCCPLGNVLLANPSRLDVVVELPDH